MKVGYSERRVNNMTAYEINAIISTLRVLEIQEYQSLLHIQLHSHQSIAKDVKKTATSQEKEMNELLYGKKQVHVIKPNNVDWNKLF